MTWVYRDGQWWGRVNRHGFAWVRFTYAHDRPWNRTKRRK